MSLFRCTISEYLQKLEDKDFSEIANLEVSKWYIATGIEITMWVD